MSSVFVLSGSSAFPGAPPEAAEAVIDAVQAPIGFAVGGPEDIAKANAQQDYDFADQVPAYVAGRASGDHVTVSTDPGILAEVAEIGINWMDFTLTGNRSPVGARPLIDIRAAARPLAGARSTYTVRLTA